MDGPSIPSHQLRHQSLCINIVATSLRSWTIPTLANAIGIHLVFGECRIEQCRLVYGIPSPSSPIRSGNYRRPNDPQIYSFTDVTAADNPPRYPKAEDIQPASETPPTSDDDVLAAIELATNTYMVNLDSNSEHYIVVDSGAPAQMTGSASKLHESNHASAESSWQMARALRLQLWAK
jgi:hypothetical protein